MPRKNSASVPGPECAPMTGPKMCIRDRCFIVAALAGAIWGMIVGFLKTRFGINEVLSMIMFNWIAFYLSNFIADLDAIHSTGSAEATKDVADAAMILLPDGIIESLGLARTANWGIFLAIIAVIIVHVVINKTTMGYELKAVGFNRSAAEYGLSLIHI